MRISVLAVVDEQNAIGKEGDQLVYISEDLKRFKKLTSGKPIIMGRKTYEALPNGALPNRRNIVLTHDRDLECEGCDMAHSLDDVSEFCAADDEVFVIGGGEIYKLFLPFASKLYISRIHHIFNDVDTWFPIIDRNIWKLTSQEGPLLDKKSGLEFSFSLFER